MNCKKNNVHVACHRFIDKKLRTLISSKNKDENAHRFALSAIRGEFLEREREKM